MAFIPDVHLAGSFVNLNTETGLAVNQNFFIQNKSSKDVIIVTSPTQPMSLEDGIHLRAYEEFILPPTTDYYWAYGFGDIQFVSYLTQITVTGQPVSTTSLNLDQSIRYYPSLTQTKIQTAAPTSLGSDIGAILYSGAGASGVGNSAAGTTSREDGFTIYPYNDYFDAKITNLYTAANDIKITIEFALVPTSIIVP
ncbi:MAG: hypothetical protein EOM41_01115 [Bacilli bacterium]|nr:hypothetical protein [Bacilli bacterium]